ncbi:MAG: hypothetical protein EBZ36_06785, partial [Acidobacteria bacterium]|nr:hypothetical protein [Acidobacteriota bacterium]
VGWAGVYQGTQTASSNRLIEFGNVTGGGNFGALYFTRLATPSSILDNVRISNGGNGNLGSVALVAEGANITVSNSRIDGGFLETLGASINANGTTFASTTSAPIIDTIVGGILGDRNLGTEAILVNPTSMVADPLGRGVFFADTPSASYIRFLNTTRQPVVIGGITIAAGSVRLVVGGGSDFGENVNGLLADAGLVTGLTISTDGKILYFIDAGVPSIRAVNISSAPLTIAGAAGIEVGNVQTFCEVGLSTQVNSLAVHPTTGEVFVSDPGVNKVLKLPASPASTSITPVVVAGGGSGKVDAEFVAGPATSLVLLTPRALAFNGDKLIVSVTGQARVIEINSAGNATLLAQFPSKSDTPTNPPAQPYNNNPYVAGIVVLRGKVFLANGNSQDLIRIDTPSQGSAPPGYTPIAGLVYQTCDYTQSTCGDGGPSQNAQFYLNSRNSTVPIVGLAADANGLFVADQGPFSRGRIRYINLHSPAVEVAGVSVAVDKIETVAGVGIPAPYNGTLATSTSLGQPIGVTMDNDGNLWLTESTLNKVRFVNLGTTPKTIFPNTASQQVVEPGTITTVNSGQNVADPTDAITAQYDNPHGMTSTAQGIFIADSRGGPVIQCGTNCRRVTGLIRFFNTTSSPVTMYSGTAQISVAAGQSVVIAGGSTSGDLNNVGDQALPREAKFIGPTDVAVHPTNGNIYIADAGQRRVRLINRQTGAVSTLSGLSSASPNEYTGLAFDSQNRLLVVNAGNRQVLREKTAGSGTFDVIVGSAPLNRPRDVVEGRDGALYVINAGDTSSPSYQIVKVTLNGAVGTPTVLLGSTMNGYLGDGLPVGTSTRIDVQPEPINVSPLGAAVTVRTTVNIIVGKNGELIFADSKNNAIRRIR